MSLSSEAKFASSGWSNASATVARYASLLKLRPMSAVIYSAVVGLIAAPGSLDALTAVIAILCIALGGGGSAALNMWYEADIDARMARTARRALPSGKVKANRALLFGSILCLGSVAVMGWLVNWFAAAVLTATIAAYFGLYTVALKRRTSLNVLIGGSLAGVLTPLSGWAAATGSIGTEALILFVYVLFWTPPHVWAQATYRMTDYANAGVPMLPATAGIAATQRWIFAFTVVHVAAAVLPWFTGAAGMLYLSAATLAGAILLVKAAKLLRSVERQNVMHEAREFFRFSIYYIVIVLTALAIDRTIMPM